MIVPRLSCALALALTYAGGIGKAKAEDQLAPAQNHDGVYAIDITTRQGSCEKGYHWTIAISGGHVRAAAGTPMEASGQISQRGVVNLAFERFGQIATVKGRFATDHGSGTWYSPTLQCGGSWQANRQG